MSNFLKRILIPGLFLLLLFSILLVYWPGLAGDFIFDDFTNIVNNTQSHLTLFTLEQIEGVLGSGLASTISRPLSMLSFGLNYYFTGLDPFYFKITNLVIHILISTGIYLLSKELLVIGLKSTASDPRKIQFFSLLITACWALHPLNVSAVLYVVQRMNQLSALVVIYTLVYYCKFRQNDKVSTRGAVVALGIVCLLMVIGVLFKENAVLLVLFILTIEIFLLNFKASTPAQKLFLKLFLIFLVALPAILGLTLLVISPDSVIGNYGLRTFTWQERLLTEARALWVYISWLLMPDTRAMVFYHDNYPVSHSLLDPLSTLFAVLGILALLVFCWLCRKKLPLLCFGIAFFLAGHVLESSVVGLELMFEHRNYLPGFGLIFGGVYTLLNAGKFLSDKPAKLFLGIYLAFLTHGTYMEANKWSSTYEHLTTIVRENPGSHRINYGLGYMYNLLASFTPDNSAIYDLASEYHRRAAALDEKAVRSHFGMIIADSQNNKPLDPVIVDQLRYRLRTNELVENGMVEIHQLTECWYGNFCKFDKATLVSFYQAIAENQVSSPLVIQAILDQLGTAIAYIFGDKEDGRALLYLAKSKRDVPTAIDLQLIQLEIELAHFTEAENLLAEAKQKSGNRNFNESLAQLEQLLIDTQNKKNGG